MNVLEITLVVSLLMLLVALLTYLSYIAVRKSSSQNISEPYLCGESVDDFKNSISVGSSNLYWGATSATLSKFYKVLRDEIHTGVLNDWFFYMGIWLTLGIVLGFIIVSTS